MENKDNNKNSQEDDSQMQNETGENNDQSDQINSSQVHQQDADMKSEVLGSSLVDADMKPSDDSIMKKDSNADAPIEIK
jgi:hypothetical protein